MSRATFTFGRFNPPTEAGHGKLVKAVQDHAEETGGKHYIFPSHTQDKKKNPLSHEDKVGAMRKLFPNANVVSHDKVKTAIDAMKHLESKGHTHVTMVVGSDRVAEFHGLLSKYRKKEYPGIKKVEVKSAGHRDPDAEGAEGMSASKLRGLVSAGKKKEFVSHYSDPKLGAHIHDKVKAGMQMESVNPVGIFLIGGPGSGKDYVLKNIFSRFDLIEVQVEHILNGSASELLEQKKNIVINGALDEFKISEVCNLLEGYSFDHVYVSVTNKVSRLRNGLRDEPMIESKRLEKWYRAEKLAETLHCFKFNNSINLNESSEFEKVFFADQIEKLLARMVEHGLGMQDIAEAKTFAPVAKHKSGLPKKYVKGLTASEIAAKKRHIERNKKLSDRDPKAYKDMPGDKRIREKGIPLSKHTIAVRKMMGEAGEPVESGHVERRIARGGNITAVKQRQKENKATAEINEGAADKSLAAKAEKSGVSLRTLKAVYRRGVAAWNSGHRPGTTPAQWGHARVNSYINKGKTYHTADKDLREEADINELFEMQLVGTDEYRKHAIAMTPGQGEPVDAFPVKDPNKKLVAVVAKPGKPIVSQYEEHTECGTPNCCGECESANESNGNGTDTTVRKTFKSIREAAKKEEIVDLTPTLKPKKQKGTVVGPTNYRGDLQGLPVTARFNALEAKEMPVPRQIPAPPGGHPVPPGYERVKSWGGAYELRKIKEKPATVKEAVEYHIENQISFTDNAFRPGSEMFFEMIKEAKRLYEEGKYTPKDDWEIDMLKSDIGEVVEFEGQQVVLDYPIEEGLEEACWSGYTQKGLKKKGDRMVPNCVPVNEEDETGGKGIGKPWREGGGGAVYVRDGGSIRKVRFSQSGMKKRYMEPGATRSFVARHHCLTNKDKTSASYWACRWPRFFSNSGKTWW